MKILKLQSKRKKKLLDRNKKLVWNFSKKNQSIENNLPIDIINTAKLY